MNTFESIEWRKARLVHVNVDFQNDFCPGGSLAVTDGDLIADNLNDLADAARQSGGMVVHTRDWHPATTNHFADYGGPWPSHCVADTHGAEFQKNLVVLETDTIISKGTHVDEDAYSGFQGKTVDGQTLEQIITPNEERPVIVTIGGLATDYCVKATVLDGLQIADAHDNKIKIIAVTDAMKAVNVNPNDGEIAMRQMEEAGAVLLSTRETVKWLGRLGLVTA